MTGMDWDAYIDTASAMLDLDIADAHRPGVARFLALAAGMAEILDTVEFHDDDLALAPVYRLPEPAPDRG